MSSLTTCITKAGKALNANDAAEIRQIANDLGDPKAAIDEYLETLAEERADLATRIEAAGGKVDVDPLSTSRFSTETETVEQPAAAVKEELNIRAQLDDEFTEKFVDKEPANPIAQMSKIGAITEALNNRPKSLRQMIRYIMSSTKDAGIKTVLGGIPQSKANEFIRSDMKGVDSYVSTMKRMDGFINERLEEQAETGALWKKMIHKDNADAKLMGEVMHGATMSQTDPSKAFELPKTFSKMKRKNKRIWMKRQIDHKVLKKAWDRLSPEAQALFTKVRDDYAKMRSEVLEALEDRINATEADNMAKSQLIAELRKQFEAGRIDPYFPLARFGKHWATAYEPGNPTPVAFIKRENREERNQWVTDMQSLGYDAYASQEKSNAVDNVKKIDPNFVAKVTELTKGMETVNEKGKKANILSDDIWQMYLRSLPEMSARNVYIHRKGRHGFAGDALRAYGYHMFHGTHQLGKLHYSHRLQTYLDNMDQEATELISRASKIEGSIKRNGLQETHAALLTRYPAYKKLFDAYKGTEPERIDKAINKFLKQAKVNGRWARPLADEMQRRHDYNMNPTSASWATKMTGLGFFWFLSTSPAAGMLNLTQTAIVGLPALGAKFTMGSAAIHLLRASGQLVRQRGDMKNSLRGEERAAFEEFDRIGMFEKTRAHDLQGFAERGMDYDSRWNTAMDITGWIFHKTEKWNREVTALAAYRLAKEAKQSHEAAIITAEKLVEISHFDYTNTNRPRFMQGDIARVALLFRNYSLNMTYRLARDFRDGVMRNENVDVEVRNEAAKRLAGILSMTFLFAGLSGMPLKWVAHSILDSMLGDDDEPYDSEAAFRAHLTEIWGEEAATFITHGAWDTLTDTTLSTRASLNNLWIREVPDNLTGKDWAAHILGEAAGPMWGIIANASEGYENLSQGYTERGIEKLMPKFISDTLKAMRFSTEGARNYDKDVIMSPEEFTKWELFTQWAGFTPARLTTRYEQQRAIKDFDAALTARKNYLMDRLFMAAKNEDKSEVADVMKLIMNWNKKNPREVIDGNSIQRSAKSRAAYDMRTIQGTAVSTPKRQYLHEQFRMTDRPEENQ